MRKILLAGLLMFLTLETEAGTPIASNKNHRSGVNGSRERAVKHDIKVKRKKKGKLLKSKTARKNSKSALPGSKKTKSKSKSNKHKNSESQNGKSTARSARRGRSRVRHKDDYEDSEDDSGDEYYGYSWSDDGTGYVAPQYTDLVDRAPTIPAGASYYDSNEVTLSDDGEDWAEDDAPESHVGDARNNTPVGNAGNETPPNITYRDRRPQADQGKPAPTAGPSDGGYGTTDSGTTNRPTEKPKSDNPNAQRNVRDPWKDRVLPGLKKIYDETTHTHRREMNLAMYVMEPGESVKAAVIRLDLDCYYSDNDMQFVSTQQGNRSSGEVVPVWSQKDSKWVLAVPAAGETAEDTARRWNAPSYYMDGYLHPVTEPTERNADGPGNNNGGRQDGRKRAIGKRKRNKDQSKGNQYGPSGNRAATGGVPAPRLT
ncbi:hypothetical protein FACS189472_05090 [Alphaproteobacteria bacterium]|nr:hypothetical protein FACS189472_05090 [Alphaproteobacteria bacterium]